ncbi:MAG: hypothetical protein Q9190_005885 [Brigantiaea leucoxantha]
MARSPSAPATLTALSTTKLVERLPQINYSLMKDNVLRKKLSELGIPSVGPRSLLIQRHAEWVNIVNANADSAKPKSKREMLRELETWDRTQGRQITNGTAELNNPNSVMSKEFDGTAWAVKHSNDFSDLISQARRNAGAKNSDKAADPATAATTEHNVQQDSPNSYAARYMKGTDQEYSEMSPTKSMLDEPVPQASYMHPATTSDTQLQSRPINLDTEG